MCQCRGVIKRTIDYFQTRAPDADRHQILIHYAYIFQFITHIFASRSCAWATCTPCCCQLLANYFRKHQNYTPSQILTFTCVGGGVLAPRSQEMYPRNNQLRSQHSKLQSAHFSTARTCDHVKTSGASTKCQIARGFHVYVTHGQAHISGNYDYY